MSEAHPAADSEMSSPIVPQYPPAAEVRRPGKILAAATALLTALTLQGDAHPPTVSPQYSASAAATSGESPICTTKSDQGPTLSFDCLQREFPSTLSSAARRIVRATVTINLHFPQYQFGGDLNGSLTATKVSNTEAITAGHLLPVNPAEEFYQGNRYIWIGNVCGRASDLEGDQGYGNQLGFRTPLRWIWDSFYEDLERGDRRQPLSMLEVVSTPDVSVVKVAPNKTFTSLPTVSYISNPTQVLETGDELLISSDQPDGNGNMRGDIGSPRNLAQPDVIKAIYLAPNWRDPATFFVLTGIGSDTPLSNEPTATVGGASGSTAMLENGTKGVGLLVGGKTSDDNQPIPESGKEILRETGVRVVDRHGNLVPRAFLDLVQAVPPSGQLASAAIRGCNE